RPPRVGGAARAVPDARGAGPQARPAPVHDRRQREPRHPRGQAPPRPRRDPRRPRLQRERGAAAPRRPPRPGGPGRGGGRRRATPRPTSPADVRRRADALRTWRAKAAQELALDPGVLFPQRLIDRLAAEPPRDLAGLEQAEGVRRWRAALFGGDILKILAAA